MRNYWVFLSETNKPKIHRSAAGSHILTQEVHDILKTGFDRSPMFTGRIEGLVQGIAQA